MQEGSQYKYSKPKFEMTRNFLFGRKRRLKQRIPGQFLEIKTNTRPDFPVLTFENDSRPDIIQTYHDLHQNSHRFARALLDAGLEKGDRFVAMMYNYPELVHLITAASVLGVIVALIDPRTKGHKLAVQIGNSKAKAVFITADLLEHIEEIRDKIPFVKRIFGIEKPNLPATGELSKYPSIQEILDAPFKPVDYMNYNPKQPMKIVYTSGTTGDPKGILVPNNFLFKTGILAKMVFGYRSDDILYTGLSLTHGNAVGLNLGPALYQGKECIFSAKFTKSRLWDLTRKYGVTLLSMLGGMASGIFNEPPKPNDADNPVRQVMSAGMPRAIWADFERRFDLDVFEWYSTAEGGGLLRNPPGKGPIGSCGKPFFLFRMKVVDENGKQCHPNVSGEVIAKPIIGKAKVNYNDNPEASAKKTKGGWNRTGDMAHVDKDGWWYFDHRFGGGLRKSGDFIQPDIVERVIGEHPDVSEVSVFGIPAASGAPGESDIVAGIALFEGKEIDAAAIFQCARRGLEANSVPSYLLLLDEIPKTISQKPQERFLEESFEEHPEKIYKLEDYKRIL